MTGNQPLQIPWASVGPLIGVFSIWLVGLLIYAIRSIFKGRYHSTRVSQMGGTRLLGMWLMEYGYWMIHGLGGIFIRLKVRPNVLTSLSLITAIASAILLYIGSFGAGGWLMVAAALFDAFDGMVARELGVASDAGEYFDSVVDRYCELFAFVAVMGYYFPNHPLVAAIVGLAMVGSIMITFNRAKGEAHGITGVPSGLMRRHERLLYLGVGTAASPIAAVWLEPGANRPAYHVAIAAYSLVAILGNITAVHLAVQIHKRLRETSSSKTSNSSQAGQADKNNDLNEEEQFCVIHQNNHGNSWAPQPGTDR